MPPQETAPEHRRAEAALALCLQTYGGKATAATLHSHAAQRPATHRASHVQALSTGLDSHVGVGPRWCTAALLLGPEELEA